MRARVQARNIYKNRRVALVRGNHTAPDMRRTWFGACLMTARALGLLATLSSGVRAEGTAPQAPCESIATCQAACAQGSATSCVGLADQYERGTEPALAEAAVALQGACDRGEPDGCSGLALALLGGDGLPVNKPRGTALLKEALRLAKRRCAGGDATHCVRAAVLIREVAGGASGETQALLRQAAGLKAAACKRSEQGACVAAAQSFAYAVGVSEDRSRALQLVKLACARREAHACYQLGVLLANADRDRWCIHFGGAASRTAMQSACDLGDSAGCQLLAEHPLVSDTAKVQARARVADLNWAACQRGNFASCAPQEPRGAQLLTAACNRDFAAACAALGAGHLTRACQLGSIAACTKLACNKSTPDELAIQRTLRVAHRSCLRGDAAGCVQFGEQLGYDCSASDASGARAFFYLETACLLGDVAACNGASVYGGEAQPRQRADRLERRACELGAASACNRLIGSEPPPAWIKDDWRYCK